MFVRVLTFASALWPVTFHLMVAPAWVTLKKLGGVVDDLIDVFDFEPEHLQTVS